jgi:16S rRNA (uracil1498-N3)-methyltransferase
MTRVFVESHNWKTATVSLPPEEAHRLLHVLRAQSGDVVTIFDGSGREATARFAAGAPGAAVLHVLEEHACPPPPVRTALIQSVPKGSKMDLIVEKATEMGVSAIMPAITARTVVRLDADQRRDRVERWKRISLSAVKQCGTPHIPEIAPIRELPDILKDCGKPDLFLVATLEVETTPLADVIGRIDNKKIREVAFLIGPEGDLTANEVALAVSAGAIPVSLGRTVLRSETAAMYALSVLRYELESA